VYRLSTHINSKKKAESTMFMTGTLVNYYGVDNAGIELYILGEPPLAHEFHFKDGINPTYNLSVNREDANEAIGLTQICQKPHINRM
jgi:hypothetical protein